jgi:hypothetical protein
MNTSFFGVSFQGNIPLCWIPYNKGLKAKTIEKELELNTN